MNQKIVIENVTLTSISAPNKNLSWKLQVNSICYQAKGGGYGTFILTQTGLLKGIMLTHISGYVSCDDKDRKYRSLWGCSIDKSDPKHKRDVFTVITDADDKIVFPANVRLDSTRFVGFKVPGVNAKRTKHLVYTDFANPKYFTKHQELRIWFSEDLLLNHNISNDNGGTHCVKVYAKF